MRRHQLEGICPTHASHSRASCKLSKLLRNSSFHPILTAKGIGLMVLSLTRLTFVHRVVQFFTFEKNSTVAAPSVLKKMLRFRAFGCSSMAIRSSTALRGREFGADVEQLQSRICEQLHVGNNSGSGAFYWRSGSSVLQMSTIEIPRFHFGCLEFDHVTRTVRMLYPKQTVYFTPSKRLHSTDRYVLLNLAGLKVGKDCIDLQYQHVEKEEDDGYQGRHRPDGARPPGSSHL